MSVFWSAVSAFFGAAIGVFVDRMWRRIESIPLLRLHLGYFETVNVGKGIYLEIENVGLDPLPEYQVGLFHTDRGWLNVFESEDGKTVFPQYPQQANTFRCVLVAEGKPNRGPEMIRGWFHRIRDGQERKEVACPIFSGFRLRVVIRNGEAIWFDDEGLGNNVAKEMYELLTGQPTEQHVENVYYRSKAPFWVEWARRRRNQKMFRNLDKVAKETKSNAPK